MEIKVSEIYDKWFGSRFDQPDKPKDVIILDCGRNVEFIHFDGSKYNIKYVEGDWIEDEELLLDANDELTVMKLVEPEEFVDKSLISKDLDHPNNVMFIASQRYNNGIKTQVFETLQEVEAWMKTWPDKLEWIEDALKRLNKDGFFVLSESYYGFLFAAQRYEWHKGKWIVKANSK